MNPASYTAILRKALGHEKIIVPGVNAIIQNQRAEVLLQERTDFRLWGLPGGSVEIGESVFAALKREIKEETGLEVFQANLIGLYTDPRYDVIYPNGDALQNFVAAFHVTKWSGTLQTAADETIRLGFFRMSEMPEMVAWHREILADFAGWAGQVIVK